VHKDKFKIRITVGLSYIRKHSWWLACSPIFSIWVSSKKIPKSYIGWPQQPPTEKVPNISKKLDFWWSIPQKGTSIGHFGAGDDQTIWIRKFFEEIGLLRPVRLQRPLRSIWSFGCQGWSNHQDQQIIWWHVAVEVIEAIEVVEAVEVIEAADVLRTGKSLLRTSKSSRSLNSALFWCFEKKNVLVESWNVILNFSTFSVGGCWGQPMLLFWKQVEKL
jgi:hypothetical protein